MGETGIGEIFDLAIEREAGAHRFYSAVAGRMSNSTVREEFARLAAEELGHRELLVRMKYDPAAMATLKCPAADYHVAESEPAPELSIDMPPRDAIALAMKKEQQAVEFYRGLAASALTPQTRDIFSGLANMELGHKVALETVFVDIGYPEVF